MGLFFRRHLPYSDNYDEDSGNLQCAKKHRVSKSSIILILSIFCGIILALIVVVGIVSGSIFHYQFKADAIYLHSTEYATFRRDAIPLPHVRNDGLDGVKVTLNDHRNEVTVGAGNINGYTRISGQLVVTGFEKYDQSINIGFEEKDEYGRTVFVPIVQNWLFASQPVIDFDVPLKERKYLDMVIYGNEDGTESKPGFAIVPGTAPPPYYVEFVFNRVILSKDEASPKENFHSIDRLPLSFLGIKTAKYSNNPLDEQAIDVTFNPIVSNIKINTDGYFQYYKELIPDMKISLPEEIDFVEVQGLEAVYTHEFNPGIILLSNIKPVRGVDAKIYIPKGTELRSGYVTKDDYIITQYVQRTPGFQVTLDKIEKHFSTLIFVVAGLLLLIVGYYSTVGSNIAELHHTVALVISAVLSVFALLLFNRTNGRLFSWSFQSVLLAIVAFLLLATALSIISYLLIFSISSGEPFYVFSILSQIFLLSCIGLAILTALITIIYFIAICFALYVLLMLSPLNG